MPLDSPTPAAPRGTRSFWQPILWRGLAFAITYLAAVAALLSGVGVTERSLAESGLAEVAYYSIGLFVLGGLDIGTPVGGPLFGRALLWSVYFIAPVITASALIEATARLISPLALRVRPLNDHIVLAGAGRLTLLYVRKLRNQDPSRSIVVVERNPNHPSLVELRELYRAVVVIGDITRDEVLQRLRLGRAHKVLLMTGDDFANLDAAARILRLAPERAGDLIVHVSDLGFMRETADSSVARGCEIFNGQEFAARYLVQEHLLGRFEATPYEDLVVLAGFGRFGQTVLHQLQEHARGSFGEVVIIDEHAVENVRTFEYQIGFGDDYERSVIDGDILAPDIWTRIGEAIDEDGNDPVIVLGCGDDSTNLHAAFLVSKRYPTAYTIVRTFHASPFAVEIADDMDAHAFDLAALIEKGMPPRWF